MHIFSSKDIPDIQSWYQERNLPIPDERVFPGIGYVVKDVAAGFLYRTDSSVCIIDGYIANPLSTREEKDRAFDEITEALLMEVNNNEDFTTVLAFIKHPRIEALARYWGFSKRGNYSLLLKELT